MTGMQVRDNLFTQRLRQGLQLVVEVGHAIVDVHTQLIKQFGCNLLGSLIVAWILAATAWGFASRVLGAVGMGVFVWVSSVVPMAVWYRFPTEFMIGGLVEHAVGWLLGGILIAWWLGRTQPRRMF